ncbi:hypothetical protein EOD41_15170 [Mucilaginibacter limnophilus]|uniref:Uncharacterized protein n=1 Tax=Mucilaginibacter limnophilus TaxID=1932778 RepID=A0A3S2UKF4_9SPHI|nr:hypothetical protein [Mucilaginibacter limnophilus]RVT99781.1 hypothetical protein EOD41_15170 [Mucilaginibacter limnophilus]
MIKKTVKTITGKLSISIPQHLGDITLGQMIALQELTDSDDIKTLSILSGIPADELKQVNNADELSDLGSQVLLLAYQMKNLYDSEAIPEKITFLFEGKTKHINVIKNLSVEPAGAFMAARDIISDEISAHIKKYGEYNWEENFNPSLNTCCQILAHYFYCRVTDKPYNEYAIEAFTETIKTLRVTEALPISKHFFTSYPGFLKPKTGFWHRARQLWNNAREYNRLKNLNTSTQ